MGFGLLSGYGQGWLWDKDKSGGDSALSGFNLPDWYQVPYYDSSQKNLDTFSGGLLKGDVPDYYKPIGQFGGPEFENFLQRSLADVRKSAIEGVARQGRARGGALPSSVANASADVTSQLRYSDFLRAMQGRENLMKTGLAGQESVRQGALTNQSQRNTFNQNNSGMDLRWRGAMDDQARQAAQDQGEMISGLVDAIGGGVIGGATGGPFGALAGAAGGLSSLPNLDKILNLGGNRTTSDKSSYVSNLGAINNDFNLEEFLKRPVVY